jgi:hypothetical protein
MNFTNGVVTATFNGHGLIATPVRIIERRGRQRRCIDRASDDSSEVHVFHLHECGESRGVIKAEIGSRLY